MRIGRFGQPSAEAASAPANTMANAASARNRHFMILVPNRFLRIAQNVRSGMRHFPRQPNLTLRRTHAETDSSDKAIVQSCDKLARRANRQKSVQPLLQKYFVSLVGQISGSTPPVYRDKRGDRDRHDRAVGCDGREGC